MAPVIVDYWEKAEFPFKLLPGFAKLNLAGGTIHGFGCPVSSGTTLFYMFLAVSDIDG